VVVDGGSMISIVGCFFKGVKIVLEGFYEDIITVTVTEQQ
jgi:hypothetical protein